MSCKEIVYFDRKLQKECKELVYGGSVLDLLYGKGFFKRLISFFILPLIANVSFFSWLYGLMQKASFSKRKVRPFIEKFHVNMSEFVEPEGQFRSFNDFFIRHLKPGVRPMSDGVVMPADARYLVIPNVTSSDRFFVKGQQLSLSALLEDEKLAARYEGGAMAIARLCPVDYHRFHFPCDGKVTSARKISGPLFSVNPIALRRHLEILCKNKREITTIETEEFGQVLYIEIGATYVGTIHQTYDSSKPVKKGDEKGYFSFGGSCVVLLFEKDRVEFSSDLIDYSSKMIEVRGQLGQPLCHPVGQVHSQQ